MQEPRNYQGFASGANRDRTGDLLLAKQALSHLSYGPEMPSLSGRFRQIWRDLGASRGRQNGPVLALLVTAAAHCCPFTGLVGAPLRVESRREVAAPTRAWVSS